MTGIILSGNTQMQPQSTGGEESALIADVPDQLHNNLGEDLWEMWQQAGLEPIIWPNLMDDLEEGR